jgi:hypothetical protein
MDGVLKAPSAMRHVRGSGTSSPAPGDAHPAPALPGCIRLRSTGPPRNDPLRDPDAVQVFFLLVPTPTSGSLVSR